MVCLGAHLFARPLIISQLPLLYPPKNFQEAPSLLSPNLMGIPTLQMRTLRSEM